jgi:hypothetical protein
MPSPEEIVSQHVAGLQWESILAARSAFLTAFDPPCTSIGMQPMLRNATSIDYRITLRGMELRGEINAFFGRECIIGIFGG